MEDSSSRPKVPKFEQDPRFAASDLAAANPFFSPESIADSLTSALENGDLDRLARSRRAFQSERQTVSKAADEWTPPDLEAMLERRNAQRAIDEAVRSTDDLRQGVADYHNARRCLLPAVTSGRQWRQFAAHRGQASGACFRLGC